MAENVLNYKYLFIFNDGQRFAVHINLDNKSLKYVPKENELRPSSWTKLDHFKCQNCPLNSDTSPECPLALNLSSVVPRFSDMLSFENVHVIVESKERTYSKDTTLQNALSAMLGIFMVTSDCPNMTSLRPMVRFHLPFASVEETIFRSASTYLLGQYFKFRNGGEADWNLKNLKENYKKVQIVNTGMAQRMRSIVDKDANLNALVVLDVFAKELPYSVEKSLETLEYLFREASPENS
jgi:hypothetical protein